MGLKKMKACKKKAAQPNVSKFENRKTTQLYTFSVIALHFFATCCLSFTLSQAPSLALNHPLLFHVYHAS